MRLDSRWASTVVAALLVAIPPVGAANQPWVENARIEFRLPNLDGQLVSSSDDRFAGNVYRKRWARKLSREIESLLGAPSE